MRVLPFRPTRPDEGLSDCQLAVLNNSRLESGQNRRGGGAKRRGRAKKGGKSDESERRRGRGKIKSRARDKLKANGEKPLQYLVLDCQNQPSTAASKAAVAISRARSKATPAAHKLAAARKMCTVFRFTLYASNVRLLTRSVCKSKRFGASTCE